MTVCRQDLDEGRVDLSELVDTRRTPMRGVHPGTILKREFLDPLGVSTYRLAKDINVSTNRIAAIVGGQSAVTADTALRFARYFGTDAQSWINLQTRYDLAVARRAAGRRINREVKPLAMRLPNA